MVETMKQFSYKGGIAQRVPETLKEQQEKQKIGELALEIVKTKRKLHKMQYEYTQLINTLIGDSHDGNEWAG